MLDNKLLTLFNSLNGVEKRACTVFLQSPYFNQRNDVTALWQQLLQAKGQPAALEAERCFAAIYPKTPFDAAQWRYLQSFLLARVEAFLAQRALEQMPLLFDLHLAPVYREKGLHKPLSHIFRRIGAQLDALPRDHEYYYWQYRLEWEQYAAVESQARTRENNLAAVGRAFDIYLLAGKLRLACLMASHRAVYNTEYEAGFLPALLVFLQESPLREVPIVALYRYCYLSLTQGDEANFRAFRETLEAQSAQLPAAEQRTLLLLAINYCIRQLNTGERRYLQEAFDLYRVGLDTRALLENGHLSRFAYKNIVALALRLEAFVWAQRFIHEYELLLEEKYRDANRDYNMARLHFMQKDYREAMPLLARVDESDLLLNLDSRIMLLKMYYESGEWEALDALMASFKILLLRKKKVIGYHQAHYLNTLRYLQKLVRIEPGDKKAKEQLRELLLREKALIEREWLLEMLA